MVSIIVNIKTQGSMEFRNLKGPVLWHTSKVRKLLQGLKVSKFRTRRTLCFDV